VKEHSIRLRKKYQPEPHRIECSFTRVSGPTQTEGCCSFVRVNNPNPNPNTEGQLKPNPNPNPNAEGCCSLFDPDPVFGFDHPQDPRTSRPKGCCSGSTPLLTEPEPQDRTSGSSSSCSRRKPSRSVCSLSSPLSSSSSTLQKHVLSGICVGRRQHECASSLEGRTMAQPFFHRLPVVHMASPTG